MPTTREVEAARVERMRRRAEQLAAEAAAKPRSARDRRIAEAHARATAPIAWRCKVPGCPMLDEWQPAATREEAHAEADRHYDTRHAEQPTRLAYRQPKPLGSPPPAATPPRPPRSAWDDRTEDTWIDKL